MLNNRLAPRVTAFMMLAVFSVELGTLVIAQTTDFGRISGSVLREGGERVPAAMVVVSNTDGRVQRTTKSNAQGSFIFSGLPAGSYVIQGCSEESGPSTAANVELKAGMEVTRDLTMSSGFVKTADPSCFVDSTADSPIPRPVHHYTGASMSIDLKGDIKDFFQSIAAISGLQFDVEPAINPVVAVHLKNIPWDLALDVVLRTSGLGSEPDGKVIRITRASVGSGSRTDGNADNRR